MTGEGREASSLRVLPTRREWAFVGLLFLPLAYVHGSAGVNANARLDTIYAFVEPGYPESGTFRIDRFVAPPRYSNTPDWSRHGGHYYANKAPGTAWLGVVVYGALYGLEGALGVPRDSVDVEVANAYLINLFISVAFVVLGAYAFVRVLEAAGVPERARLGLGFALVLGTGLFPYATQLWGHPTAAGLLLVGLAAGWGGSRIGLLGAGLACGLAVCTDYLAGIGTAAIGLLVLARHGRAGGWYVAGGLGPLAGLLAFHWSCFGHPLTLPYAHQNPAFQDGERALGMFGPPTAEALYGITVSPYRGALLHQPLLLLCLPAWVRWLRRDRRDPLLWLSLGTTAAYVLAVASFNGWHGGTTVLCRYLLLALPFALLSLKELPAERRWVAPGAVLAAVSAANMTAVAAVGPVTGELAVANPLYGRTWSLFLEGQVTPWLLPIRLQLLHPRLPELAARLSWTWGELAGLRGLASLAPLLAVPGGIWLLFRSVDRAGSGSRGAPSASAR